MTFAASGVPPFGEGSLVLSAFEPHLPLTEHCLITHFEFLQRRECELQFRRLERLEHLRSDRRIEQIATQAHAVTRGLRVAALAGT